MSQWNKQLHTTNTFLFFDFLFFCNMIGFNDTSYSVVNIWKFWYFYLFICWTLCVVLLRQVKWKRVSVVVLFLFRFVLPHGHTHLYRCSYMCHHTCISILVNVLAPWRAWPNEATECIHKIATQLLTLLDGDSSELCSNANKFMILSVHLKKKKNPDNKTKTK